VFGFQCSVRGAADGSLRVGILLAAGLTRRREDAKKNTQGQSSVVGRQASRGRKSAGGNSAGCWPHAKTRRREEKHTRSVVGCRSSSEPRTEAHGC